MTKLGLTLNEAKTSPRNARQERFDFLGYSFGPHRFKANGKWYLSASPSEKSIQRLKTKVRRLLASSNNDPWDEVRDTLNRSLLGWSNYFSYGTRSSACRAVDHYVYERVLALLWQNVFTPLFFKDLFSAVRTPLRRPPKDEIDDGVTYGGHGWLRWRPVDSFFSAPRV
jgi:hypothetical protein